MFVSYERCERIEKGGGERERTDGRRSEINEEGGARNIHWKASPHRGNCSLRMRGINLPSDTRYGINLSKRYN